MLEVSSRSETGVGWGFAVELSANVELLFTEHDAPAARVRVAGELGLPAVEIWGWRRKDIDALGAALTASRVSVQTMCVEPMGVLVDSATHPVFLAALADSAAVADRRGAANSRP